MFSDPYVILSDCVTAEDRTMTRSISAALLLGAMIVAPAAIAQQKAHEHGHWQLNAAVEDGRVMIELVAPGADVAGFEHEARTADEKARVWKAKEKLKAGGDLIVLPAAAGCSLAKAHADLAGIDHDGHDDHKDHHHKDDHKDDHHKDGHQAAAHNEYHAEYVFTCTDIARLDTIGVTIFDAFPTTEEVEATVLTAKGQRAAELDRNNTVISLDGLL